MLRLGYVQLRVAQVCLLEVLTEHGRDAVTRPNAIVGRDAVESCLFRLALPPPKAAVVMKYFHSASVRPGHLHQAAVAAAPPQARSSGSIDWGPLQL